MESPGLEQGLEAAARLPRSTGSPVPVPCEELALWEGLG